MKIINNIEKIITSKNIKEGSKIYVSGNAATPQVILKYIAKNTSIKNIEMMGVLFLGNINELFSEKTCKRINHRIIFNSHLTRKAVNKGRAKYLLMHLGCIPQQIFTHLKPNIVLVSIVGPDNGGNYSLGTTVEGVMAAIKYVKEKGGLIIAERNKHMPFVLGCTIPEAWIDYLIDTDYLLPTNPIKPIDDESKKIGEIIAQLYIKNGSTIQYGIGQVPEAVTEAIIDKGVSDLGIHTELFSDAMRYLVNKGIVTNKFTDSKDNFSKATIFLSTSEDGYKWLNYNSSVQSRESSFTNSILEIAKQPNMVAINGALGIDLHGNIWADSLTARQIYSGVGGQCDFIRGASLSYNGLPIIALKSRTINGLSKIINMCPKGITTTVISADPVIIVTEYGAFDSRGLSLSERAVGIANLAAPEYRDVLMKTIYNSSEFNISSPTIKPKNFISYDEI